MKDIDGQKAVLDSDGNSSWRSMLNAVPVKNIAAEVQSDSESYLTIIVKSQKKQFPAPLSWIVPQRKDKVLKLDAIGVSVWTACDGESTVESVIERFSKRYKLTFHEARVAVTNYLKRLIQRGALAIVLAPEDTDCHEKGITNG